MATVMIQCPKTGRAVSTEIETDLAQVISELTSKQAAVEASLRLIGQISQLTLLDFL